jgi:4-hydroxybenzoate polyprenyltransferase
MATMTAPATAPVTDTLPPLARARTYASFVRFEHTLFSLPLILAGIFSVSGPALSAARWALIALAAVGARTAAMAMNRLIDRRLDALNPRTQVRELPSGRMRVREAWALLGTATAAYLAACWALGPWYLKVAVLPLLVFAGYPYLKRFTPLCHLGVGLALALAPPAGFAAAHPDLRHSAGAMWLAVFALCWVSGFDIIYATLDEAFDRERGVHSLVVWLGRQGALRVSAALHGLAWASFMMAVLAIWIRAGNTPRSGAGALSLAPWLGGLGVGVLLFLEQRWAEDVNLAFFKVNVWVGFAVLVTVLAIRAGMGGF